MCKSLIVHRRNKKTAHYALGRESVENAHTVMPFSETVNQDMLHRLDGYRVTGCGHIEKKIEIVHEIPLKFSFNE